MKRNEALSERATYADLLRRTDAPPGSSWGLWGPENDLGTLNFITEESVRRAAACVRRGVRFNLDLPFPVVGPESASKLPATGRVPAVHHIKRVSAMMFDDHLDAFFLQGGTQIDALRHCRHPRHGFYNAVSDADIRTDSSRLGIGQYAEAGIVGRGVLLDVLGFMQREGREYDVHASTPISVRLLEEVRESQGLTFASGDILLLRTGAQQAAAGGWPSMIAPGLEQTEEMVAWLWDAHFALLASDNATLELHPNPAQTPFTEPDEFKSWVTVAGHTRDQSGMLHGSLLGLLGFAVGELWALDELAAASAADGDYECMIVAKPLNITAGAGSPANVTAMR